jgi:glycerol uptake facilitator-like aquaporin
LICPHGEITPNLPEFYELLTLFDPLSVSVLTFLGQKVLEAFSNNFLANNSNIKQYPYINLRRRPKLHHGYEVVINDIIIVFFVKVVFAAAADEDNAPNVKGSAPLAIGLSIAACHMFAVRQFPAAKVLPAKMIS